MEDDDVRRPDAGAELLQRPLVRLVGGLARDREALVPALRDLTRGEGAEECQHDPGDDHLPAMSSRQVSEFSELRRIRLIHAAPLFVSRSIVQLLNRSVAVAYACGGAQLSNRPDDTAVPERRLPALDPRFHRLAPLPRDARAVGARARRVR